MPLYDVSPFSLPPKQLISAKSEYLFGSFNGAASDMKGYIKTVAIASNVATVTFAVSEGDNAAAGSLLSIRGTAVQSGVFNVTNVAITSCTTTNGIATVVFPLTGTDLTSTAQGGVVVILIPEIPETLANNMVSIPCVPPAGESNYDLGRTWQTTITFPTLPTACVVTLQTAQHDVDSEYSDVSTAATVSGGAITTAGHSTNSVSVQIPYTTMGLARFKVTGLTGTGTIIAKILA